MFDGSEVIAEARRLARSFLNEVQGVYGLRVSERALSVVELIVSELFTNTRKYAPGPCRITLRVHDGCVEVSIWDSNPNPPAILPADPLRIGQHGLEIVVAASRSFHIRPEHAGKRITASIALDDDPDPDLASRRH
ncbi:ATP-binding protein [Streptomyces sp. CB00455]|uniref:ATP-binding protein n=1 Tax=Streptomyces sp. CB00455 TaxID=1703927 RepID=UPI001F5B6D76|nr:ATP-binding protein [Streptomyces sp. CB00455]